MPLWNHIGEFFLFRWLFGKSKKSTTEHDAHTKGIGTSIDRESKYPNGFHDEDIAPIDDAATPVGDDLLDGFDNSEDLDDFLDIFMRDNKGNNRSCLHHGDYDNDYNVWNSESYSQSYDDFHDEQDDYDMMDDDF